MFNEAEIIVYVVYVVYVDQNYCIYFVLCSDLVVVHFAADWAPQCKQMNDVIIEMSKDDELNGVNFLRVRSSISYFST